MYDSSWEGFLSCVYQHYYGNYNIVDIIQMDNYIPTLYEAVDIEANLEHSSKVENAIMNKMSDYIYQFLQECFLSRLDNKEKAMLDYIIQGFKQGRSIYNDLSSDKVITLYKAHKHLKMEAHRYLGLVRFYKADEVYISVIEPSCQIIPLIAWHFTQRFAQQDFIIYDKAHKQALMYFNKQTKIIKADDILLPQISQDEIEMQALWKGFYTAIAIKERTNPNCRMNFMPKRTWTYLPEMQYIYSTIKS